MSFWQILLYVLLAIVLFFVIKNWTKIANFTREVKTELRKATWPWDPKEKSFAAKYRELIDSTVVVIIAMILLAAFVSVVDIALLGISKQIF